MSPSVVVCSIPEGSVQGYNRERKYTGIMLYQSRALSVFQMSNDLLECAKKTTRGQVSKFNQHENNLHFMKKYIGLIILVIAFVAFTGCTQQAVPEPVSTTPPTTIATSIPTAELTQVRTPLPTTVVTTMPVTTKRTESPIHNAVTIIHMQNNSFVPQTLAALPGTGITWINDDKTIHSLKMTSSEGGFNSGDIMPGTTYSYTFGNWEGTYVLTDPNYPDMKGTVIINNDVHP
jgi:plastocyanin